MLEPDPRPAAALLEDITEPRQDMMPQFAYSDNYRPKAVNFAVGLSLFVFGAAKKLLIADNLIPMVDAAFATGNPQLLHAWLGLLDVRNMTTSLVLLPIAPIAPIGVWIGVHWARRISQVMFYRFLYTGMLLTGLKLVWDGLLA